MPLYEFICPQHGIFELLCRIGVKEHSCQECGVVCDKIVSRPAVIADNFEREGVNGFYDPGTDKHWTSKNKYYSYLKSKGYGVYDPKHTKIRTQQERAVDEAKKHNKERKENIQRALTKHKVKVY